MLQTNSAARKLSSAPQTHRTDTLRAIAQKAHDTTASIKFLATEAQQMSELLENVPDDSNSRLAWLNSQLHNT
jgi:hypothetical protein